MKAYLFLFATELRAIQNYTSYTRTHAHTQFRLLKMLMGVLLTRGTIVLVANFPPYSEVIGEVVQQSEDDQTNFIG